MASNFYVREFLKRHPGLTELKTAAVGHHRAKQATLEVRDAVFKKLQVRLYALNPYLLHIFIFIYSPHIHSRCSTALLHLKYSQHTNETSNLTNFVGSMTKWVAGSRRKGKRLSEALESLASTTARVWSRQAMVRIRSTRRWVCSPTTTFSTTFS